jgi:plasmid maintenance system killer protein
VREFGLLRNYFEGKYLGERFVQEVKDARQHCSHQNVTTNLLKKLHQGKALEAMASTQSEKVNVYKPTGQFNTKKESLKGNVYAYTVTVNKQTCLFTPKNISVPLRQPKVCLEYYFMRMVAIEGK